MAWGNKRAIGLVVASLPIWTACLDIGLFAGDEGEVEPNKDAGKFVDGGKFPDGAPNDAKLDGADVGWPSGGSSGGGGSPSGGGGEPSGGGGSPSGGGTTGGGGAIGGGGATGGGGASCGSLSSYFDQLHPSCAACMTKYCCAQSAACSADTSCTQFSSCVAGCATTGPPCANACNASAPASQGIVACAGTACPQCNICGSYGIGTSFGSAACDACMTSHCCAQGHACAKDTTCVNWVSCHLGCAGNTICQQNCYNAASSSSTVVSYASCATTHCVGTAC